MVLAGLIVKNDVRNKSSGTKATITTKTQFALVTVKFPI